MYTNGFWTIVVMRFYLSHMSFSIMLTPLNDWVNPPSNICKSELRVEPARITMFEECWVYVMEFCRNCNPGWIRVDHGAAAVRRTTSNTPEEACMMCIEWPSCDSSDGTTLNCCDSTTSVIDSCCHDSLVVEIESVFDWGSRWFSSGTGTLYVEARSNVLLIGTACSLTSTSICVAETFKANTANARKAFRIIATNRMNKWTKF